MKKDDAPSTLALVRNPDILAGLGSDKGDRILVGFAAETHDVESYARAKLAEKNLDLIVANDVSSPGLGFGGDDNKVSLVDADGVRELPVMSKRAIARAVVDETVTLVRARHRG